MSRNVVLAILCAGAALSCEQGGFFGSCRVEGDLTLGEITRCTDYEGDPADEDDQRSVCNQTTGGTWSERHCDTEGACGYCTDSYDGGDYVRTFTIYYYTGDEETLAQCEENPRTTWTDVESVTCSL